MTKTSKLAFMYQRVIQQELGLMTSIDDDGDVEFRHPDLGALFVSLSEDDPEFLRIIYSGFTSANTLSLTREGLFDAVNTVNQRCKAAKLTVSTHAYFSSDPRVSASVECFIAGQDTMPDESLLRAIFSRCIGSIRHSAKTLQIEASSVANVAPPPFVDVTASQ